MAGPCFGIANPAIEFGWRRLTALRVDRRITGAGRWWVEPHPVRMTRDRGEGVPDRPVGGYNENSIKIEREALRAVDLSGNLARPGAFRRLMRPEWQERRRGQPK